MISFKRDKKEEEEGSCNPFQNLEKTTVLQEARTFNETPVNPRKCTHILTKILYLLNQGEQLGTTEATEAFFAVTKLFQSKDVILRRMVYLGIKELSPIADDVIIVTSSLTRDMTGKEDLYRAAAIRALCSITDATMLQTIERYMKQAIVDRNPGVSSAALVSSLHLTKIAGDVVKRWVNEAQEAVNSDSVMVQYHALGVLYHIRKTDRLAVTKLVARLTRMILKSPYAVCMLIRIVCKLIEEESGNSGGDDGDDDDGGDEPSPSSPLFDFLESCLRHKSEMVVYEAAHAIVNVRRRGRRGGSGKKTTTGKSGTSTSNAASRELASAISILQLYCSNPKATIRFAAVRTLNKVAMTHPAAVTACNLDLENLITDSNRSIATLAITTLLKTGAESSVDRLMKQISSFVSEISDEFKIVVVQAIRALCLKFPRKHLVLMNFLSGMLRDEGGLDYKASIADTIITVIEDNPDAKETGLAHLCEFIEDCEHTSLAVRILHLLGKEGPRTKHPSRYIRYVYNRMILENSAVRAAAVAAMAQFGATCPDLLPNVLVLLARCLMDTDDEVRDRATYYHNILSCNDRALSNRYILDNLEVSIPSLERALHQYTLNPTEEPFDITTVPAAPRTPAVGAEEQRGVGVVEGLIDGVNQGVAPGTVPGAQPRNVATDEPTRLAEKLKAIQGLEVVSSQSPFRTSEPVELTESETEYVVRCIKHMYKDLLLLQFDCTNTLNDQLLENVRVQLECPDEFEIVREVPILRLPYSETHSSYVLLRLPEALASTTGTFGATLKFLVKDCDPATGQPDSEEGYDDEYILEDIEVSLSDHMRKVTKGNFASAWEETGAGLSADPPTQFEIEDTYSLSGNLEEAVKNIVRFMGMAPCERSDRVPEGRSAHTLLLSGIFRGGYEVLVRAKLALIGDGVTMQLTVRSTSHDVAELITLTVG